MKNKILIMGLLCSFYIVKSQQITELVNAGEEENQIKSAVEYLLKKQNILHIKLDTRFDYQGVFGEHTTEESSFKAQTIKLIFDGEIAPGVRYLVRQRLNRPQDASLTRDNNGPATDFAFIELDAGSHWTFRIGKQPVMLGTYEFEYNPANVYLSTTANDDFAGYKTGVNIAYKTGKQVFNLQAINSEAPQFANQKYKNKAMAGVFLWEGSLFKGVLGTRYGYGIFQHDGSKYYNWLAVGNQLNIKKFTAELDWFMGNRNINFSPEIPDEKYIHEQSASVNLVYHLGKFKPLLKGTWNKRRDQATSSAYFNKGIQAGVEYFPFTDPLLKDLRFHAVYIFNKNSYHGVYNNLEDVNKNTVIVGMRWLFKAM